VGVKKKKLNYKVYKKAAKLLVVNAADWHYRIFANKKYATCCCAAIGYQHLYGNSDIHNDAFEKMFKPFLNDEYIYWWPYRINPANVNKGIDYVDENQLARHLALLFMAEMVKDGLIK
jgi:hypothetical protein